MKDQDYPLNKKKELVAGKKFLEKTLIFLQFSGETWTGCMK